MSFYHLDAHVHTCTLQVRLFILSASVYPSVGVKVCAPKELVIKELVIIRLICFSQQTNSFVHPLISVRKFLSFFFKNKVTFLIQRIFLMSIDRTFCT